MGFYFVFRIIAVKIFSKVNEANTHSKQASISIIVEALRSRRMLPQGDTFYFFSKVAIWVN
jgi:hypothetical protein